MNWFCEQENIRPSELVVYGESLGTYAAVRLGAKFSVLAVILEAPFLSFIDLAPRHYPMIPSFALSAFLKDYAFSNKDWISKLRSPLFVMHGDRDEICPIEMSRQLFGRAPEPKVLFEVPGGGHNDLPSAAGKAYVEKPFEFVQKVSFRSH